jgi:hypothetical protein
MCCINACCSFLSLISLTGDKDNLQNKTKIVIKLLSSSLSEQQQKQFLMPATPAKIEQSVTGDSEFCFDDTT